MSAGVFTMLALTVAPTGARAGLNVWTTAGPEGGSIYGIAVDPETSGVVYASAPRTIFKSTTRGSIWVPLNAGLPTGTQVGPVAIDPTNPRTLYVSIGVVEADGIQYARVFKSTDGGRSWNLTSGDLRLDAPPVALAVDPLRPTTVYAWGADGVHRSTDGGAIWAPRSNGLAGVSPAGNGRPIVFAFAIDPKVPSVLYASTGGDGVSPGGLFKTADGGGTWVKSQGPLPCCIGPEILVVDPHTSTTLYGFHLFSGVYKSTDGGSSWSSSNVGLPDFPRDTFNALAIDPKTPSTLYAAIGYAGVFKTTNGGLSWSRQSPGLDPPVLVLAVDPQTPTNVFAGTLGGGVFLSTDGGASWSPRNAAVNTSSITTIAVDPQTPTTVYAANEGGVVKSTNGGASWRAPVINAPVSTIAIDTQTPAIIYAGTTNSLGIFKSTDGGSTWAATNAGVPEFPVIEALAVDPKQSAIVYAGLNGGEGVLKSTNAGGSWAVSSAGLGSRSIKTLAIDPQTTAIVYAGTYDAGVFKSTNGGASWSASNTGLSGGVAALAIDPQAPATIYAAMFGDGAAANGVFKSTDGGASWRARNVGLTNPYVQALAIDPQRPTTLYTGTFYGGVFSSTDGGASWAARSNTGLTDLQVTAVVTSPGGACLHIGTNGGVFEFATRIDANCLPPPPLVAALETTTQSVAVGAVSQTVATVENVSGTADGAAGVACGITQLTGAPTPFTFQAVDPATGQPVALLNAPVDIAPATSQRFRVTLTPSTQVCPTEIQFGFSCTNTGLADILTGRNTLLLSAGPTAGCGVSASASANQASFSVGQTLIAGGSVTNAGLPGVAADFYVGMLRPDRSIQFVTPAGLVAGHVSDLRSFRPLAVETPLATPFSVSQASVLTHQWAADDQRGTYVFFVLAVKARALAVGTLAGDQILKVATAPFSFP